MAGPKIVVFGDIWMWYVNAAFHMWPRALGFFGGDNPNAEWMQFVWSTHFQPTEDCN